MMRALQGPLVAVAWLSLTLPASAQTPSFPCNKAQSPLEIAVCADGGLATLDRALDQAYRRARDAARGRAAALTHPQRPWLRTGVQRRKPAPPPPPPARAPPPLAPLYPERLSA